MMVRNERVLVPVNQDDYSLHGLDEAFRFTEGRNAEMLVLAVVPRYEGDLRMVGVHEIRRLLSSPCDMAISKAQQVAAARGCTFRPLCKEGAPYEVIVETADEEDVNLIIMGVRQRNVLDRMIRGNVPRRTIGFSSKDVLLVPDKSVLRAGRILHATDGSRDSRLASERAIELAKDRGGKLCVVSVADGHGRLGNDPGVAEGLRETANHIASGVVRWAELSGVSAEAQAREGNAVEQILAAAQEWKADMLVVGARGRTGIKRLLMGSVTDELIGRAQIPTLVVVNPEAAAH